ncbi:RfaL Lipid A core - O-antigen ligase and related enzymes [Fimbriimonadaceae bacterium]
MTRPVLLYSGALFIIVALSLNMNGTLLSFMVRLSLSLFAFTWILDRFPKFRVRPVPATVGLLSLFVTLLYASSLWAIEPTDAILYAFRFLLCLVAVFLIYDSFRSWKEIQIALQAYVVGLYAVFIQIFITYLQGRPQLSDGRYGAEGIHPNHAAVMLGSGLAVAWLLAVGEKPLNKFWRVLNFSYVLAALYGVMLTGSRGGFIACVPSLIVICIHLFRKPGSAVITAGIFFAALPGLLANPSVQKNIERIGSISESASADGFTGRGDRWKAAIEIFKDNPIIGVGAGGYRPATRDYGTYAIHSETGEPLGAHSSYLQFASELGIVGLSIFVGLLLSIFLNYRTLLPGYRLAFMTGLLSLANAMISEMIEARYFTWIFIGIGLSVAKISQLERAAAYDRASEYTESVPSTIRSSENLEPATTAS